MDDLKRLIIYSKLNDINNIISDDRITELLKEYKINSLNIDIPNNYFTCSKCNLVKHEDHKYSEMYGGRRKYFDKCIDCQDLHIAEYQLKKQLYDTETPLQNRIKFIDINFYYKYRFYKKSEKYDYVSELCERCVDNKLTNHCDNYCPYEKRIKYLTYLVNDDISNKFKTIDSIVKKEHIELKKLTIQLNRKIAKKKNSLK